MSIMIRCGQCGQENPSITKYCESCGNRIDNTFRQKLGDENPHSAVKAHLTNACPICRSIDRIQKLSSICAAETRESSGSTRATSETTVEGHQEFYSRDRQFIGSGELSGSAFTAGTAFSRSIEQSNLAKKLIPPIKPFAPKVELFQTPNWYVNIPYSLGFGSGCLGIFAGYAIALLISLNVALSLVGGIGGAFAFGMAGVLVGLIVQSLPSTVQKLDREKKQLEESNQARFEQHKVALRKWEHASRRWQTLYYCYRDDIVFAPGENDYSIPEKTLSFCYRGTEHIKIATVPAPDQLETVDNEEPASSYRFNRIVVIGGCVCLLSIPIFACVFAVLLDAFAPQFLYCGPLRLLFKYLALLIGMPSAC
jgi:hypothetical protein